MVSFNHSLSAILRGHWLLERSWAESHLPLVLSLLKGNPVSFVERTGNELIEKPFAIDPRTMQRYEWREGMNANIPEGSIGILPISGPITKYNGDCGEPGAIQKNSWLMQMGNRAHISAVIMMVDTPGGEARAASTFTRTIQNFSKPILSYVDGMSASLGMWLIAGSDEIYVSSKMDQVGSVGSYIMLADFKGYFESQGLKVHEIYAPQSKDKNKDYRDALKGEYSLIETDLELHVDEFISYIKTQRPKAAATAAQWSTGKMFYAEDAQRLGLIDGIKDFQQVISKAAWLGKRNKK